MTQNAVDDLEWSQGWEVGVGPTVVVVDDGLARNLSTSTLRDDAYALALFAKLMRSSVSRGYPRVY